jgi:hypothetical protein
MASSSAAVVVVVIVIVLLLLLAFFWCGCGGGCGTSCSPKLVKSYVPFSAGGLAIENSTAYSPITTAQYLALGDGNASAAATFAGALETAGSNADSFAAAFTRDGQVRRFTVHAYLAGASAGTVTVGLYISPKASDQPAFALAQSATFDTTTSATYFYSQLTTSTNVKAGDRWVVLVTAGTATQNLYVVSGGFEYAQCC